MDFKNLVELDDFEKELSDLTKYKYCNASLSFFIEKHDLKNIVEQNEFESYVGGMGIINLEFLNDQSSTKTYRLKFSSIKGFDIDTDTEFEIFETHAKEYLEEISEKIKIPITIKTK